MIGVTYGPLVELRGGFLVLEAAYHLLLDLEARGHVCTVQDGALLVTKPQALSAADREAITAHRRHLVAMLGLL